MNSLNRKIGLILSYILILLQTVVGLIYVPLLLHFLGDNEYGLYQLMGSIISYFSIMDFGISNALISYYSKAMANDDIEGMENLLYISKRIYSIITLIIIPIAILFYVNINNIFSRTLTINEVQEAKNIFIFLIVNIVITLKTNIYTSVITSHERFIFLKSVSIIQILIQPILVIVLLMKNPIALTVVFVQTFLNLIVGIIKVVYSKKKLNISIKFHYWDKLLIRGLIKLSLSVFIVSVVDQLFWRTNQFILGVISGTGAVALYSIASQIYMNYMPLSSTIQGVLLPHITKKIYTSDNNDNYVNDIFFKVGRLQYILLLLILLGFILYGKEFIILWAGKEYIQAYYITLIILIPFTFDLVENTSYIIMQANNNYSDRAILYSILAILNLILSVSFARIWGPLGCGIATGLSMFLMNVIVMNIYYKLKLGINVLLFFKNLMILTIRVMPGLIFCYILKKYLFITNWKILILNCLIFAVLYIISIYFGMNDYEKNIIHKLTNRVYKKKHYDSFV